MKLIEAAESGYATANSYFLLMWTVVAVAGLTTFFEVREIEKSRTEALRVIDLYDDLLSPVEKVDTSLTRVVVAGPHFEETRKALAELRANFIRARHVLANVQSSISARTDLETDARVAVNTPILFLRALLLFNDLTYESPQGIPPIVGMPSLLLSSQDVGTIGIADNVTGLRFQDASRLLWLSSIPMRDIVASEARLLRLAGSNRPEDVTELARLLKGFEDRASVWSERDKAAELWVAWRVALNNLEEGPNKAVEERSLEHMTLQQPITLLTEAETALILADARAKGGKVDVNLPGLALPLRLADILIFLPIGLTFFLAAIYVYTWRGLRYGTQENVDADKSHEIVGKTPVYFLLHGNHPALGWLFATIALVLPLVLTVLLPTVILPNILGPMWTKIVFGIGAGTAVIALLALLNQVTLVEERIENGTSLEEE